MLMFTFFKSDRSQFVHFNDESSMYTNVSYGVPQGSVSVCYADDTHLYLSLKPDQNNRLTKLQTTSFSYRHKNLDDLQFLVFKLDKTYSARS